MSSINSSGHVIVNEMRQQGCMGPCRYNDSVEHSIGCFQFNAWGHSIHGPGTSRRCEKIKDPKAHVLWAVNGVLWVSCGLLTFSRSLRSKTLVFLLLPNSGNVLLSLEGLEMGSSLVPPGVVVRLRLYLRVAPGEVIPFTRGDDPFAMLIVNCVVYTLKCG